MEKKLRLKQLVLDYAIYNIERHMTKGAVDSSMNPKSAARNKAELNRLDTKCEDILRELTQIIDEL